LKVSLLSLFSIWPGIKIITGVPAGQGDPEYGTIRGRLLPDYRGFLMLGGEAGGGQAFLPTPYLHNDGERVELDADDVRETVVDLIRAACRSAGVHTHTISQSIQCIR